LGICIFYIQEFGNIKRGRIVYLPNLSNDIILWRSVLYKCFEFFKTENCCSVSAFSRNDSIHSFYSLGMVKSRRKIPIFIKDKKHILKSDDIKNWYFQFTEGDLAYRGI